MSDDLKRALEKVKQTDEARNKALAELAILQNGPREIDSRDQQAINENLEALAKGDAVVVQHTGKRRPMRANEIDYRDQKRITRHLEQIRTGLMVICDSDRLFDDVEPAT
jgi:tRNA A37 N6-isopentenylltransferase MiaA